MKTRISLSSFIFCVTLVGVIIAYMNSFNHSNTGQHIGFAISIILLIYFLFVSLSKKYINFRNRFKLEHIGENNNQSGKLNFLTKVIFFISFLILLVQLTHIPLPHKTYIIIFLIIIFAFLFILKFMKFINYSKTKD